jgi:hypothetical protein
MHAAHYMEVNGTIDEYLMHQKSKQLRAYLKLSLYLVLFQTHPQLYWK